MPDNNNNTAIEPSGNESTSWGGGEGVWEMAEATSASKDGETKKVERFRILLVVGVLGMMGAAVLTYLFVSNESNNDYKLSVSSA